MERGQAHKFNENGGFERGMNTEADLQLQKKRVLNLLSALQIAVDMDGRYSVEELTKGLQSALRDYLQSAKAEYGK